MSELPHPEGHVFLLPQKILPLIISLDENVNSRGFIVSENYLAIHLPPEGRRPLANVVKLQEISNGWNFPTEI